MNSILIYEKDSGIVQSVVNNNISDIKSDNYKNSLKSVESKLPKGFAAVYFKIEGNEMPTKIKVSKDKKVKVMELCEYGIQDK